MTSLPRAIARKDGLVPGFASRADILAALRSLHLKTSELQLLFHCSRGTIDKLVTRPDFPKPFDVSGDGHNLRYVFDEVIAYRDGHRREIRALTTPFRRRAPPPSAEAAVRTGLAALRTGKTPGATGFR
jgi:predicted DNA-binding transcriptional regulator AlpA